MEDCHINEPDQSRQWPLNPCPGCGAMEVEDCECEEEEMFAEPTWKAGPESMRHDPDSFECGNLCGTRGLLKSTSYPCQGEINDLCGARICEDCKLACHDCACTMCSEHVVMFEGEKLCQRCAKGRAEIAAWEAA